MLPGIGEISGLESRIVVSCGLLRWLLVLGNALGRNGFLGTGSCALCFVYRGIVEKECKAYFNSCLI
jgi:hypothetical protein